MRNWFQRMMSGRHGLDQFSRFLTLTACVIAILSLVGSGTWLIYLWYPAVILLIYSYFRMFSRNLYKRDMENQWYLNKTEKIRARFKLLRTRFQQRRDYRFFNCPNCDTVVRVPKGKGAINITCPKCRERFTRKS